jgi:RNAse (barnase) inhibitor barstar
MRIIKLDATSWRNMLDFYNALLASIGAPTWHGRNLSALQDSMIYGGINAIDPPYTIRIFGAATLPQDVLGEIERTQRALADARGEFLETSGNDTKIYLEIIP